jgi:hypothetical protein
MLEAPQNRVNFTPHLRVYEPVVGSGVGERRSVTAGPGDQGGV